MPELHPQVEGFAPSTIELAEQIAEVGADQIDVVLQPLDLLPSFAHANRSFVMRMSRWNSSRVRSSGLRMRRCQLRPASTATAPATTPLTIRPATQAGITSASANAPVTSSSV